MRRLDIRATENLSYKIVALLITLILWIIIFTSKESVTEKVIPVQYVIAPEMISATSLPNEARFRIVGNRLTLKKVAEANEPFVVDLSSAREGVSTIRIHADNLDLPASAKVVGIVPPVITVKMEKVISKLIPVEVVTSGSLPKGKKLVKLTAEPSFWEVSGARSEVGKIGKIKTLPLDLSKLSGSQDVELQIDVAEAKLEPKSQGAVRVRVVVK